MIRGYDQAHRLFRGRRTETYTQSTASDVATKVAQRAGLTRRQGRVDQHGLRPPLPGRRHRLGVPGRAGPRDRLRDRRQGRQVRLPQAAEGATTAPDGGRAAAGEPAGAAAGHRPAAVPVADHRRRAGQGGAGPGLGPRPEEGVRGDRAGQDDQRAVLPTINPADIAKKFGDPVYVATRRRLPHARPRWTARPRPSPSRSPAPSPSSRGWPAATRNCAPAPRSRSTTSARRSTASTPSPPRATATTRTPATPRRSR